MPPIFSDMFQYSTVMANGGKFATVFHQYWKTMAKDISGGTALSTHAPKTLNELKKLTFRIGSIRRSDTTDTIEIGIHQTWGQLL